MTSNKIMPTGETTPQQNAASENPQEDDTVCYTSTIEGAYLINPIIALIDKFAAIHMPILEMGAYESLWMSPSASFQALAEILGAEYATLPSHFVDTGVAFAMIEEIDNIFGETNPHNVKYFIRRDYEYPIRMLDAEHRVQLLYYRGHARHWFTRCVSVTGSKRASIYGKERAAHMTRALVENGFTIVSGMSGDIDLTALETAMNCGGKVIGVLGTPITECSPKKNRMLQEELSNEHLLVSPVPIMRYLMQTRKENRMFIRDCNATISALSEATLIVEAGNKSDCLSQARAAFKQKRKVLVLDSCFGDAKLTWPARFEKKGALRIRSSEELADELAVQSPHISMDPSIPLPTDNEDRNIFVERVGEYVDSGIVPGYVEASEESQLPPGSSAGKYWRVVNELNQMFDWRLWTKPPRGGEIVDDPDALPSE